jgi:hypothetical protein
MPGRRADSPSVSGTPDSDPRAALTLVVSVPDPVRRPDVQCVGQPGDCGPMTFAELAALGRAGRCCRDPHEAAS